MLSYQPNHDRRLCYTLKLHAGRSGVRLYDGPDLKLCILVGSDRSFRVLLGPPGHQMMIFFCFRFSVVLFGRLGISICFNEMLTNDVADFDQPGPAVYA